MEGESPEIPQTPELTPELASDLLVYSFHLSQGDAELQAYLFQYLHQEYPDWKIGDQESEEFKRIQALTIPIAEKYALAGQRRPELNTSPYKLHTTDPDEAGKPTITKNVVAESVKEQLNVMRILLNGSHLNNLEDKEALAMATATNLVLDSEKNQTLNKIDDLIQERDAYFKEKGREIEYHKLYVVDQKSTRVPVYDRMFKSIRNLTNLRKAA